jgi:pimeloyl-ACP methyl ester carboxylesterase
VTLAYAERYPERLSGMLLSSVTSTRRAELDWLYRGGVLIHGRGDISGPAITAWDLARAWPGSELVIIEDSGHTGSASMRQARLAALDRLYDAITSLVMTSRAGRRRGYQ